MKKTLLALALAAARLAAAHAQAPAPAAPAPAGYAELLAQPVGDVQHTGDPAVLAELAAKLERAAAVNPTDWLPRYYQAYALIVKSLQGKDAEEVKDQALDRAQAALAQARQLRGDESELLTLQAYLYQARLRVSPMLRSQQYAALVAEAVAQAEGLNPANPRPYLVEANQTYYTPAMFGGGAEQAKPLYKLAQAKFAAFRPAQPLAPTWGEHQLQDRLKAYEKAAPAANK